MEKRILISLREAEDLVFDKIVAIPLNRLSVDRAQKDWSIDVKVDEENIIEYDGLLFLVAGAIKNFGIPPEEENLFLNHFRVPKGLISPVIRSYKERKEDNSKINFPSDVDYSNGIKLFKHLRRALMQCYAMALNESLNKKFTDETIDFLNEIENLSKFNYEFIKTVVLTDFFPMKERNDGNFYPESVKRFNWLGAYIFSSFPGIKDLSENDIDEAKGWLLNFKDKDDTKTLKKAIENVPDVFFEEFELIIGYYFAASYFEEASIGEDYYKIILDQLKNVKLQNNNKVVFWAIFFQAIFKDDIDFLYVIQSVQEQQKNLEFKLLALVFPDLTIGNQRLEKVKLNDKQALGEFFQLQNGGKFTEPIFISREEKKQLFRNNFSNDNLLSIGFEKMQNMDFNNQIFPNRCEINKLGFSLNLSNKPSEVTFFIRENSDSKEWLKDLKLKTKGVSKLIDSNKKALVGFLTPQGYNRGLFKVYEWILNNSEKQIDFKTKVIVLLVDDEVEYIQSPEFQQKKLEMEEFCKDKFGENTSLLVKNMKVKSDGEIKRNLRLLLEPYNVKDIELINENLDDSIRDWILSINNEYVIQSEIEDYYSFINR